MVDSRRRVARHAGVPPAVLGVNLLEDEHAVELGGPLLHLN